jgi:hypothetical protein
MTSFIMTFLIAFSIMTIAVFLIFALTIAYALYDFGYHGRKFWKEFIADLKWGLKQWKITIMMFIAALTATLLVVLPTKKKLHDCPHCMCGQHMELTK